MTGDIDLKLGLPEQENLLAVVNHPDEIVRVACCRALGRLGRASSVESLLEALEDPSSLVRESAAVALGWIGAPATGAILTMIQAPPHIDGPELALRALKEIRDPQAVSFLCSALSFPEQVARLGSASALEEIASPEALPSLLEAARHPDILTRRAACQALGAIPDSGQRAFQAAISMLHDDDWLVRQTAVISMGRLLASQTPGSFGIEVEATGGIAIIQPLLTSLQDPIWAVRQEAAEVLHQVHLPWLVEPLLMLLNHPNAWVRQNSARALGNFEKPAIHSALFRLMQEDPDLEVRLYAALALARQGDGRARAMILRTLKAPNKHTRQLAAITLGCLGDPTALDVLLNCQALQGEQVDTPEGRYARSRAIRALVNIGEPAVSPLVRTLESPLMPLRQAAVQALTEIGVEAVDILLQALKEPGSTPARVLIVTILGEIGTPTAQIPLISIMTSNIRRPFLARWLTAAVYDPTNKLRLETVAALTKLNPPGVTEVLLHASRFDPDENVRRQASLSLASLGDPQAALELAKPNTITIFSPVLVSILYLLIGCSFLGFTLGWLGLSRFSPFGGLVLGGLFGLADGLSGNRRSIQRFMLGLGIGVVVILLSSFLGWEFASLDRHLKIPGAVGFMAACLSGALGGWRNRHLIFRLLGLFIGMITGFVAGAVGALMSGFF